MKNGKWTKMDTIEIVVSMIYSIADLVIAILLYTRL
jgi:hypothetical protein